MKIIASVGCSSVFFVMVTALPFILSLSPPSNVLYRGCSISVERPSVDVLVSEEGTFNAGFYQVGENALSFAIWFAEMFDRQATVVWMANSDRPVKSRASRLSFRRGGDLYLVDADGSVMWTTTNTDGTNAGVVAELLETGNLLLLDGERTVVWQSFELPTDTLLPGQPLTWSMRLVSSSAVGVYTTGYFVAHINDDNVLSFIYDGPYTSSVYWPHPDYRVFQN